MSFEQWLSSPASAGSHLRVSLDGTGEERVTGADAVLHLPLIALSLLVVASALRGRLRTAEVSAWTAGVLSAKAFAGAVTLKRYEWSVELRSRCSEALVFLEGVAFVEVKDGPDRTVSATPRGAEFLGFIRRKEAGARLYDDLLRAFHAAEARGLVLL